MKLKISFNRNSDIANFKKIVKNREEAITTSYTDQIKFDYKVNNLVNELHPLKIKVQVEKIKVENMDTKTFILKPIDREFPPFYPGQYIVLDADIKGKIYKRSYSISSSPKNPLIEITVKRVRNGIVSNYLLNEVKEKDTFVIHGPFGDFTYQPYRDCYNILALAGGSGITPIMSMARAIHDKVIDCNLDILYGEATEKELIFKDELDKLNETDEKISVSYILSDEVSSVYETGLINKKLIEHFEIGKYSYFVCGPIHFYHHLNSIFKELDIPNKYIRHDIYKECEIDLRHIEHTLTVLTNDKEIKIPCFEDESLSKAMEEANIEAPRKCLVGVCGFCRSKLIDGKVKTNDNNLRMADKEYNYIHPCVSYPLSDVTIKLSK